MVYVFPQSSCQSSKLWEQIAQETEERRGIQLRIIFIAHKSHSLTGGLDVKVSWFLYQGRKTGLDTIAVWLWRQAVW
jgi:hypothetical protein